MRRSIEKRCKCGHLARFHRRNWPQDCSVCIRRYGRSDDICDGRVFMDDELSEFESFCKRKALNPKQKSSIKIFENFVVDHGGDLDDVKWTDEENEMRRE